MGTKKSAKVKKKTTPKTTLLHANKKHKESIILTKYR